MVSTFLHDSRAISITASIVAHPRILFQDLLIRQCQSPFLSKKNHRIADFLCFSTVLMPAQSFHSFTRSAIEWPLKSVFHYNSGFIHNIFLQGSILFMVLTDSVWF